jgi:lysozyme
MSERVQEAPTGKSRADDWKLDYPAKFVAPWEGFLPVAYLDTIASPAVWTIGYGHTGPEVKAGMRVTEEEARALLAKDLRFAARIVADKIEVPLTVRQRMALISLVFNAGPGAMTNPDGSPTRIRKAVNARRYEEAADRFLEWSHAGGVVVEGLLNRRKAERWMFLHPIRPKPRKHKPHPHRPAALPA